MLDLVLEKLPGSPAASCLCEFSTAQQFTVPWNMAELDVLSVRNHMLESIVTLQSLLNL
jgi:hypothetical protein